MYVLNMACSLSNVICHNVTYLYTFYDFEIPDCVIEVDDVNIPVIEGYT